MLIEIKKDVITEALKRKNQKQNAPLDLLFQMAICAKNGNHVVWAPALGNDIQLRNDLAALITVANVNALCSSEDSHRQDIGWLNCHMTVKTVISYEKVTKTKGCIVVNPNQLPTFQPYTELFFLVENINDSEFYKILLKIYRKTKGLGSYVCTFYPLMGGGVTTAKVMENEIRLRKHFCFAIVDSDKNGPQGPSGQTGDELKKVLEFAPEFCGAYIMNDVKEIENLLPQRVVRHLYPLQAGEIDIFSRDASFFDMKCGLRPINLLNDRDNNHWKKLFPEKQANFIQRDILKKTNRRKKAFEAALISNDCQILSGFGCDLLKRSLNHDREAKGKNLQANLFAFDLLQQTTYSHLTKSQQKEFDNIGLYLFSWSCGMKAF